MKIYFNLNTKIELKENYFLFKEQLENELPKFITNDTEIKKIKNAALDGFELQNHENHVLEINVIYLESSNSIEIIWTFPITEQTQEVIEYCEKMNKILENEGDIGIRNTFKTILIADDRASSNSQIASLLHRLKNPIHITKENKQIYYKQSYTLKEK